MDDAGTWVIIANNDVESVVRKNIHLQVDPERTNVTVSPCFHESIILTFFHHIKHLTSM